MAKERERKYLLKYLPEGLGSISIQQGYLMLEGKHQLRVRITDGEFANLCYKCTVTDTDRNEYEYGIPIKDGKELFALAKYKLTKTRYPLWWNSLFVCIDVYPDGLQVVEVEYEDENQLLNLPDYFGIEVTNDKKYSNIEIAKQNGKVVGQP